MVTIDRNTRSLTRAVDQTLQYRSHYYDSQSTGETEAVETQIQLREPPYKRSPIPSFRVRKWERKFRQITVPLDDLHVDDPMSHEGFEPDTRVR